MNTSRALNYDTLRTRALNAVILNVIDAPLDPPTEFPSYLEEQRAQVRRTSNEDVAQWIKKATHKLASAWHSRPAASARDRAIDAAQL